MKKAVFGPDYKEIYCAEKRLKQHNEMTAKLKAVKQQIKNAKDAATVEEQIKIMEQIKTEMENELSASKKGRSLLGWLNRILSR